MTQPTILVLSVLVYMWALTSDWLARHNATGPLVFVIAGFFLAHPEWGPLSVDVDASAVHRLAELTLALVLFADASRVRLSQLRADVALPLRLLGVGLPITLLLGGWVAALLFDDFTWALAAYVGASLAPTDAALSVQVINDDRVPLRLRRGLNVESGLNDGIVTPVVTLAVAVAVSQLTGAESEAFAAGAALRELGLGLLAGLLTGLFAAVTLGAASRRGWTGPGSLKIATLATAVAAFYAAVALDGNGFISAFVGGIAFASAQDRQGVDSEEAMELPELGGELLGLVVWFVFGAALVPIAFSSLDFSVVLYAVLSLTVLRMFPVALALLGTGLDRRSVLFLGWFGPRGLASVVFAVLALEELGGLAEEAVAVVALTILFSVVLHGVTAAPAGRRYGQKVAAPSSTEVVRARPRLMGRGRSL